MPHGLNRLSDAIKCCVLCLAAVAVAQAQQSSPAGPPNVASRPPAADGNKGGTEHIASNVFVRIVNGEPPNARPSAAYNGIAAHHPTASAIPSYVNSDDPAEDGSRVRLAGAESDIHPMVTQLPKLDPRLSRARRRGRSTTIDLSPQANQATVLTPAAGTANAGSPKRQQYESLREPGYLPPRDMATNNSTHSPHSLRQPLQNAAQVIPANAPVFEGVRQAGYIDEAELSDLEQPLSIKVLDKPPIPQPFYQALAQEQKENDLRNAIEDALKKTEPKPEPEPQQQPAQQPQFETPPPAQRQPEVEPLPPKVQPEIMPEQPAPSQDNDLLFDEPSTVEPDSLDLDSLDTLDELNQMDRQAEDEPKIEDTIQDLLDRSDSGPSRKKSKPRRPGERLRLDFPSLLDDDLDDGAGGDGAGLDSLLDDEPGDEEEGDLPDDKEPLQNPQVSRPPRRPTNYPATLSQVFNDDDNEIPPHVEQQFCQQVWACAGGKCQSWQDRLRRNFCRDYQLKTQGCSNQRHWLGDMICNSGQCGGGACYGPGLLGGAGLFSGGFQGGSCEQCGGLVGRAVHAGGCGCSGGLGCSSTATCTESCSCASCTMGGCSAPQFSIGGWTSAGYHDAANGLFNNHPDRFNLHQQWFYAQREARPSRGRWDWGFRVDAMYGVDAQDTQAFGNNPGTYDFQNGFDHGIYGWAVPQAYGEIASENLSVIFGHFYTLIGYETVTAPHNFFYSHSMTFRNSEPFTHTGALATYSGKNSEIYFGWTLGWDTGFDQLDGGSSFLGGFSTPLTRNLNFTYITTAGDFGWRGDGYSHSLLFDWALTNKWNYVVQSDLLRTNRGEDNVGVNQYLFWNLNNNLAFGGRMEWWKGDGVTGYAPFNSVAPAVGSSSYYQATVGANIRPGTKNLVFRPEMRWDWSPSLGYDESTFGIDMVLTY